MELLIFFLSFFIVLASLYLTVFGWKVLTRKEEKTTVSNNQLMTIHPYKWNGMWVFDDPAVGLEREALIAGMPEIIELATKEAGIDKPEKGFNVIFSHEPFPGYQLKLDKIGPDPDAGTWYEWQAQGMRGWLCPALFKYFPDAPDVIYCLPVAADQNQ